MKINRFKIFFFIPVVYLIAFCFAMEIAFTGFIKIAERGEEPNVALFGIVFALIIPLHLFAMFCIFHSIYFVSKTIKTVELQRETTFSDFAGEFFLIWFYFIGIWFVQPKINKLAQTEFEPILPEKNEQPHS
ncbi:MAG: hypothetical protein JST96_06060 [Bacteroidetes bacterium]|nr:hypothetical protein [Bacteroidota bacterium]